MWCVLLYCCNNKHGLHETERSPSAGKTELDVKVSDGPALVDMTLITL